MIAFPPNTDIVLMHTPVSFSCGIDGMCRYCKIILQKEPMDKAYFLFINRTKGQVRILWYDGHGFNLCTKRLSAGSFNRWPKSGANASSIISFFEAQIVMASGDIERAKCKKIWKKI